MQFNALMIEMQTIRFLIDGGKNSWKLQHNVAATFSKGRCMHNFVKFKSMSLFCLG